MDQKKPVERVAKGPELLVGAYLQPEFANIIYTRRDISVQALAAGDRESASELADLFYPRALRDLEEFMQDRPQSEIDNASVVLLADDAHLRRDLGDQKSYLTILQLAINEADARRLDLSERLKDERYELLSGHFADLESNSLPQALGFDEAEFVELAALSALLQDFKQRLSNPQFDQAKRLTAEYRDFALSDILAKFDEHYGSQDRSPEFTKARLGLSIEMAHKWRDLGDVEQYRECFMHAMDRLASDPQVIASMSEEERWKIAEQLRAEYERAVEAGVELS